MLNKNSDAIKKLSIMVNTGASPQQTATFVMEDMVLRDAVKAVFLISMTSARSFAGRVMTAPRFCKSHTLNTRFP